MKPFAIIEPQMTEYKYKNITVRHVQEINPEMVVVDRCAPIDKFCRQNHVVDRTRVVKKKEAHVVPVGGFRLTDKGHASPDRIPNSQNNNSISSSLVQPLNHQQHHRVPIFNHHHPIPTAEPTPNLHIIRNQQPQPQSPQHSQLSSQSIKNSINNKDTDIKNIYQQPEFILNEQVVIQSRVINQSNHSMSNRSNNQIERERQSVRSGKTGKTYKINHQDQQNIMQSMYIVPETKQSRFKPKLSSMHRQHKQDKLQQHRQNSQPYQQQQQYKLTINNKAPQQNPQLLTPQHKDKDIPTTTAQQYTQNKQHNMVKNDDKSVNKGSKVPIFSKKNKIYHASIPNSPDKQSRISRRQQHRYKIFSPEHLQTRNKTQNCHKLKLQSHINQHLIEIKQPITQTRRKSTSRLSQSSKRQIISEPIIHQFHQQPTPKKQPQKNPPSIKNSSQISQINPNTNSQHYIQCFDGSFNDREKSSIFSPVVLSNRDSMGSINAISCDQNNSYLIKYDDESPHKHFKKIVGLGRRGRDSRRVCGDQQMMRCVTEKGGVGGKGVVDRKIQDKPHLQQKQQGPNVNVPKILKIRPKAVKKSQQSNSILNSSIKSVSSHKSSQISIQIVKIRQLKPLKI